MTMPQYTERELRIALVRERITSHLVECGISRPIAETHASAVSYCTIPNSDAVVIDAGDHRAVTNDPASLIALANHLASSIPRNAPAMPARAPRTAEADAVAQRKAANAAHRSVIAASF
jgi:hypothetical protein